jgi:hypothetical protein
MSNFLEERWNTYTETEKEYIEEKLKAAFSLQERGEWHKAEIINQELFYIAQFHFKTCKKDN